VRRYGSEATRIAALDGAYSESAPADTSELFPTLVAEITHAIQHEGALTVDDIVQRRIRISSQPRLVEQWRPRIADIARAIDPDIVAFPVDA
jgi:glycerol-3-phosphate dehydrogenase